jgi:thiamine biosynthesis protein ThiS
MNIVVNGEKRLVRESSSMIDLLHILGLQDKQSIAVAINGEVLPKKDHLKYIIKEHDIIEIVHAIGGGL